MRGIVNPSVNDESMIVISSRLLTTLLETDFVSIIIAAPFENVINAMLPVTDYPIFVG